MSRIDYRKSHGPILILTRRYKHPKYTTEEERIEAKRKRERERYRRLHPKNPEDTIQETTDPNTKTKRYVTDQETLEANRKRNHERYLRRKNSNSQN
jgi:hypothetical protein